MVEPRTFVRVMALSLVAACLVYGIPILVSEMSGITGSILSVVLSGGLAAATLWLAPGTFITYWLSLVLTQSLWTGLWSAPFDHAPSLVITESKTVAAAVAAVWLAPKLLAYLRRKAVIGIAVVGFIAALAISVRSVGPGTLAYARNFLVPIFIALVVLVLTQAWERRSRIRLLTLLTVTTTALLALGTIAELLLGTRVWRALLNTDKQASLSSLSTETSFFGLPFERIGGLMVEPVTSGYIAGTALVILVLLAIERGRAPFRQHLPFLATGVVAFAVMALAATKASLLMLVLAVLAFAAARFLTGRARYAVIPVTWTATLVMILAYMALTKGVAPVARLWQDPLALIGDDSTAIHLAGLVFGFQYAIGHIIGAGLGVGGNFSRNFSETGERPPYQEWLSSGSESAIGVLSYQLGLIGLVLFTVMIAVIGRAWGRASIVLLGVWSATALLAESMFGPLVAALFMIGAALLREDDSVSSDAELSPAKDG